MLNNPQAKRSMIAGLILCLTAVGIGAFGAHAFKSVLIANARVSVFETACQYHFYHGLGLCLIALISVQIPNNKLLNCAGLAMASGVLVFSGSLYLLALLNIAWLGAVTPIGGVLLIAAWLMTLLAVGQTK